MSQYTINIGALPNDGTGDPLRTAFNETNLNFDQVFSAGPVLSNVRIANNTILTTNTNGNLVLAPNGIGVVQSNVNIVPNTSNIRSLGSATQRWSALYVQYANISGNIDLAGSFSVGDMTVTGNLTVTGNTIQVGNIVTETLTIQLANSASTANAANGAGITVGADDNIATMLYSSAGNVWNMNIGLSAVGNISAPYFVGNGSQLTGLPASYGNANVVTLLANFGSNAISTTGNITGGNISAPDGNQSVLFNDNGIIGADAGFNYDKTANTLYAQVGSFSGQTGSGIDALYAGTESFTVLGSAVMAQFTGNIENYSQVNFQNRNDSRLASGDYIITADNGNDTTHFIDLGITSSNWDGAQTNSLGNLIGANDGYLYVQDGNLAVGIKTGATANVWYFDIAGNLTLPTNSANINYANGTSILSGVGVNTGNIGFAGDAIYDLNGIYLENADLSHGATAALVLPANGDANAIQLNNTYGNITVQAGSLSSITGTWTFDNTGNLTASGNITAKTTVTPPVAYANLTAVAGGRAFVNNSNLAAAGNFGAQIAGGGSNVVPVWSDGTNWYIG